MPRSKRMVVKELHELRGRVDLSRPVPSDEEIERTSPPELRNLPDDFWDDAEFGMFRPRIPISLRVEPDILAWFKAQGPGYQRRMHAVLRAYVDHMTPKGAPPMAPSRKRRRKPAKG